MTTIILDKQSTCGGRPQKIGQLAFDENGRRGITVGYFENLKICLSTEQLNELLKANSEEYRVKVTMNPVKKISLSGFIAQRLIPASIKEKI